MEFFFQITHGNYIFNSWQLETYIELELKMSSFKMLCVQPTFWAERAKILLTSPFLNQK